ncbi:glycosyltransferase family 4 protein [Flammeovirga sp. SubArs3]|uniref:glycosyltransferase family 4 protein n=1 Tax=Flammeovirga sp. SubArs3 TaxID=2995316 RepID=UPI00248C6898|nr:glycosyltransferase family 4 protein [Flammeovirga sp. SubArs3]
MKKIIVVVSHPIQYHAPIWRELEKESKLDSEVLFCTNHGQNNSFDKDFGISFKWDIPLTDGYKHKFFENKPLFFLGNFGSIFNPKIIKTLAFDKYDAVYFHGFGYLTHFLGILIAFLRRKKIILRNISYVFDKPKLHKRLLLKFFFKTINNFLYIGELNHNYYKTYDVPDNKLLFAPHIVNNALLQEKYNHNKSYDYILKKKYNIPVDHKVILFCGKLISKKQPLILQRAFNNLNLAKWSLLFVGDGNLKDKLITDANSNTHFAGFINQSEIHEVYQIADILCLPSKFGETWGLVVNEALNFKCAILASNRVGSYPELVLKAKSGYVFDFNNANNLQHQLQSLTNNLTDLECMKTNGYNAIKDYTPDKIVKQIKNALNI